MHVCRSPPELRLLQRHQHSASAFVVPAQVFIVIEPNRGDDSGSDIGATPCSLSAPECRSDLKFLELHFVIS